MIIYYTEKFRGGLAESRRLLRKALAEYTEDADRTQELVSRLQTGENGKPYIDGFDRFSVSHTGGIWAVLIDIRECGLDIQLSKNCDAAAIAKRVYADMDAERIVSLQAEDPERAKDEFFRMWARREALTKALGGTVYDNTLPSVMPDCIPVDGVSYSVSDICFPYETYEEGKKLFAAICVENMQEMQGYEPVFRVLE